MTLFGGIWACRRKRRTVRLVQSEIRDRSAALLVFDLGADFQRELWRSAVYASHRPGVLVPSLATATVVASNRFDFEPEWGILNCL